MTEIRSSSEDSIWRRYDLRRQQERSISRRTASLPQVSYKAPPVRRTINYKPSSPPPPVIWPAYVCSDVARVAREKKVFTQSTSLGILKSTLQYEAASIIQRWWRGMRARELYSRLKLEKEESQRRVAAALRIQAVWRGYKARQEAMLNRYIQLHDMARKAAARRIQQAWLSWRKRQELELDHLVHLVAKLRNVSATVIQKWWRGIRVREIIDEEWNHWVIKWIWDKPGKDVSVVYKNKVIPMEFCSIRRCYVCKMPRRPGRYEIKFLVDGRLVCCGTGTLIHSEKQYSNVYDVYQTPLPSPFEKCRLTTLKIRQGGPPRPAAAAAASRRRLSSNELTT